MKRNSIIAVVITSMALAGLTQAYGAWGGRDGYGGNYGPPSQVQGAQTGQIDPAIQEKVDAFFADTKETRKAIAMKRAEQHAMMRGDNPDPAALSKIAGELFDLETAMQEKAKEAGVSSYIGRQGGCAFGLGKSGRRGMGDWGRGGRGMGGGYMMGGDGASAPGSESPQAE